MAPLLDADNASRRDGDEDGEWTRVVRKGKARSAWPVKIPAWLVPRDPSRGRLSVEEIAARHERVRSHWRSKPSFRHIVHVVETFAATHAPVTRAICLGNGSFDTADVAVRRNNSRPHVQTEAFLTLVKLLSRLSVRRWTLPCAKLRLQ